jgi:hypothetical protein
LIPFNVLATKGYDNSGVLLATKGYLGFGYGSRIWLLDKILNYLSKNNIMTSSFDLSNGLINRISTIKLYRNDFDSIEETEFPFIGLNVLDLTEEHLGASHYSNTFVNYQFAIWVINDICYGDDEIIKINQNILNLLRNKADLSITNFWMRDISVDFEKNKESNYIQSEMLLNCKSIPNLII